MLIRKKWFLLFLWLIIDNVPILFQIMESKTPEMYHLTFPSGPKLPCKFSISVPLGKDIFLPNRLSSGKASVWPSATTRVHCNFVSEVWWHETGKLTLSSFSFRPSCVQFPTKSEIATEESISNIWITQLWITGIFPRD